MFCFVRINRFEKQIRNLTKKILVLGACGQIGTDLTLSLKEKYGNENVIASDIREPKVDLGDGPFTLIDATDKDAIQNIVSKHKISEVYNMVAMLSATAEKHMMKGWDLNMTSLLNTLELQREGYFEKLFWPSSIAVFGPGLENNTALQDSVAEPKTVYGISKLAGERWCDYYAMRFGNDVRSIRYPGIISYKTKPGGGTTDYAVEIFHSAVAGNKYECFLAPERTLPMMYMSDAIRATMGIMDAPKSNISIKSSYNINAFSFSPSEIYNQLKTVLPDFEISYNPDQRDTYAQSWPAYLNDKNAQTDWGWKPEYDLESMVKDMLHNLKIVVHQ